MIFYTRHKKSQKNSYLRCEAYMKHIVFENLEAKSDKYKFMGYSKETVGYHSYNLVEQ